MSISVISAKELDAKGLSGLSDIGDTLPSVNMQPRRRGRVAGPLLPQDDRHYGFLKSEFSYQPADQVYIGRPRTIGVRLHVGF
ncbi:MAG TPA: hypothetical protein VN692_03100 [Steroidobacteraceae bacterium]|nr:hypothetical protein [Steroidobacteraceae bacterium]